MKKILLTLLGLLHFSCLSALPIGNPTEAALFFEGVWIKNCCCDDVWFIGDFADCLTFFSLRFGYYGDFVFNRNLEIQGNGLGTGRVIRKTQINTSAGYLALNICDRVDLFTTLGASNLHISTSERSWLPGAGAEGDLFTDTKFSWSIGIRGAVYSWRCLDIGVEGQYFQFDPEFNRYISSFVGSYTEIDSNNKVKYREWQVGVTLASTLYTLCPNIVVVPYIGAKWAHAQLTTHNFRFVPTPSLQTFTIFDLKEHKNWGYAVGTSLILYDCASVAVEGRFGDERAISVTGQISF